jgi:hypothetical protein
MAEYFLVYVCVSQQVSSSSEVLVCCIFFIHKLSSIELHEFVDYIIIVETQSDTPPHVFVLAHYTIYSNMHAKLLHVSARPSHCQVHVN